MKIARFLSLGSPTLLLGSVVAMTAAIQAWAPRSGVIAPMRANDPGKLAAVRTGSLTYPRTVWDTEGFALTISRPARSVVSQSWAIDEIVYSVVPAKNVTGVSESAYQERISNVFALVSKYKPVVATDPERVLRLNPDLVLVSSSTKADFTALIRSSGVPTLRMDTAFTKLEQVAESIRLMGYVTGEDEAAEAEYNRFQAAVRRAQERRPSGMKPPRILGFAGRYSYGSETLFHDIVQSLGGVNVGAEGGLRGYDGVSTEQILRWDPEWIVSGADLGKTEEQRARILADPAMSLTQAAKKGRIVVFDHHIFLAMSPFTRLILDELGDRLYGH
jgi:iron complex transport system substrate-binding protein